MGGLLRGNDLIGPCFASVTGMSPGHWAHLPMKAIDRIWHVSHFLKVTE